MSTDKLLSRESFLVMAQRALEPCVRDRIQRALCSPQIVRVAMRQTNTQAEQVWESVGPGLDLDTALLVVQSYFCGACDALHRLSKQSAFLPAELFAKLNEDTSRVLA